MNAPQIEIVGESGKSKVFSIGKLPPRASFNVRLRIVRMVGEPVFRLLASGDLAGVVGKPAADAETGAVSAKGAFDALMGDPDAIGKVVGILSDRLDPSEVDAITDVLFSACRCDGGQMSGAAFDAAFSGLPPGAIEKVLVAALKENYRNFFSAAP
jgi:hypothetical protein